MQATAGGVIDGEARGVEREPMQPVLIAEDAVVLALPVANIADERAGQVLEVPPDLVQPTRPRPRLDERVPSERVEAADLGHGVDALLSGRARDRVIQDHVGRRVPSRDREVALLRRAPRGGERGGRQLVEREQHAAGRAAIEPMHRIHVPVHGIADLLEEGVIVIGPAAVRRDAGGFVDDDAALVAPEDPHRCVRKKSICVCSRARFSLGSGTMCVADSVITSARLPAT